MNAAAILMFFQVIGGFWLLRNRTRGGIEASDTALR